MAQSKKFYSLVGDNGYGLFTTWDDLQEAAIRLKGSLNYRKLPTARDAYKAILKDVMFRWRIKKAGVIDLASLMKKQFVLLDADEDADDIFNDIEEQEAPATVGSIYQKAVNKGGRVCNRNYGTLADLLAEDEDDDQDTTAQTQIGAQEEDKLYQLYKLLRKKYGYEDTEKAEK